jgi:hypothetical protein
MVEEARGSSLKIKLVLKGTGYEILAEGTISEISKEIDALRVFQSEVEDKLVTSDILIAEEAPSEKEVAETPTADIPAIKPVASNSENIKALFATPWGRTPRSTAEVIKALEVNAIYDRTTTISTYLLRLVKKGELRRIEKEGKWAYFQIPGKE